MVNKDIRVDASTRKGLQQIQADAVRQGAPSVTPGEKTSIEVAYNGNQIGAETRSEQASKPSEDDQDFASDAFRSPDSGWVDDEQVPDSAYGFVDNEPTPPVQQPAPAPEPRRQQSTTTPQQPATPQPASMQAASQSPATPTQPVEPQVQTNEANATSGGAAEQGGVPMLHMPDNMLEAQSAREHGTFEELYPEEAASYASAREQEEQQTEEEEQEKEEVEQPVRPSKRYVENSADRAIAREKEAIGLSEERANRKTPAWMNPLDRLLRLSQNFNLRPKAVVDAAKAKAVRAFKNEGVGNRIYGKIMGLSTLGFRDVGVGIEEIMAVIRQNPEKLEKLLEPYIKDEVDIRAWSEQQVADIINNNEVWVATFKPPNNQGQDIQRRRLKVLTQQRRGIYLHNIMAAMYTADYDGDDMEVSLDAHVADLAKDPMDYMVDIFGKISLNMDFIPLTQILPTRDENGRVTKTAEEIVLEGILANWSYEKKNEKILKPLMKAIIELGESTLEDDNTQAKKYGDMFRAARKFADRLTQSYIDDPDIATPVDKTELWRYRTDTSNRIMSDVSRAVFDWMKRTKYYNSLTTIGADVMFLDAENVPKPRTYGDAVLYKLLDGMVRGELPNNFQELKLLLTGFTGNAEGKNAPFRFTADVGKMMKMDERLKVGNEYVVDIKNNKHMTWFFQSTVKMAGSLRMARDIKTAGRSEYYTQAMRQAVIEEVGFPDKYETFNDFLRAFIKSYNRNSTLINEANTVFLTNMGISTIETQLVSPLKAHGDFDKKVSFDENVTFGDLAEPFLSIYGTYSVGKMFQGLQESKRMVRGKLDDFWVGNLNGKRDRVIEREYDYFGQTNFWITGKYVDYTLKEFKTENRLVRGEKVKLKDSNDKDVELDLIEAINGTKIYETNKSNVYDQFYLLMAIADKRTAAASKFNEKTFGFTDKPHKVSEDTTVRMMSTLLTSMNNALREGNQVISAGYYAGIGYSKEIPKEAMNAMTDVAKKLAAKNFTLRSGDGKYSDRAFQRGAGKNAVVYKASSKDKPSSSVRGATIVPFDKMSMPERKAAYDSVVRLHPYYDTLEPYVRDLMARNYYQIIGAGTEVNSAFVACYAPKESNGTWQSIRIAREQGIPVFNLAEYGDDYERWKNDILEAADKANAGQLRTESVGREQAIQVEEASRALIMSNPDLFMHFNMDSPASFLASSWGKKMLQYADDVEMLGGIYTTMVFDYKMERINDLTNQLNENTDTTRIAELFNQRQFAIDELSHSSEVWHGIIREFEAEETEGMSSYFQMVREKGNPTGAAVDGRQYVWKAIKDADDFWKDTKGHDTLRSVIEDMDIDRTTKWNVITDVVRFWETDAYLKSYEVGYQMEIGSNAAYGEPSMKGLLTIHNDFERSFNRWAKNSQAMLRDDIDRAAAQFRSTPFNLMSTLMRLDEEPWNLVSIDPFMYADSILSVYDKTYAQTEKASQNPWTNAIYSALSQQQNGGFMNDVTRTDDRLLGLTSADSITIHDIIHLLTHPEETMTVYGRKGQWGIITRDILLENELGVSADMITPLTEESLMWDFLLKEPRLASAIRKHSACVLEDSDGEGYLGASCSIAETMEQMVNGVYDPLEQTKYLMRDHPGYAGIIALALPGKGLVTRNARYRIKQVEDYLAYELYAAASSDWESKDVAEIVLEDLGITNERLREVMRSDYDVFLKKQGLDAYTYSDKEDENGNKLLESDVDADITYGYALERVAVYIDELRDPDNNVRLGTYVDVPAELNLDPDRKPVQQEKITSFHEKDDPDKPTFLSNMYEVPVTYKGITYGSSEAAFQAQKCVNEKDKLKFVNLPPKVAKSLGQKVKLRKDWKSVKVDIMREVVHAKFSNPEMRKLLDETGNAELIEGNTWNDTEWGVSNGVGQNLLGKILMEERGTLPGDSVTSFLGGPDAVSAASFWDVIQELSGAKTSVSTGVEGSETYRFAEWISHIQAKDRYADLETINYFDDKFDWNLALTNVTTEDGRVMRLHVENGKLRNKKELKAEAERAGIDEIVVVVPDGYKVRDRSTDTHGTQVASLFAYMVSKRSNGAEAFNLKAKKAGIDGKDSITKMRGKHRTENGKLGGKHVEYLDILFRLRDIASQYSYSEDGSITPEGMLIAKRELAKMMLKENEELGYKDLTLANYMSIADLMLIQGEDGELYLRSIEMLVSAIKYNVGWKIDEMSEKQLIEEAAKIVNDTSSTGIGIAMMESLDALDGYKPRSKAAQHNAVRQTSSVFKRNNDLLKQIVAANPEVEPMSPTETKRKNDYRLGLIKKLYDGEDKRDSAYIKNLKQRLDGYHVIGTIGLGKELEDDFDWSIGPTNVIYIGPDSSITKEQVKEICDRAWSLGVTVVCAQSNIDKLSDWYKKTSIPLFENILEYNDVLIPMFDARLNGNEANPYKGQFAISQVPFSKYWISVEDSYNEFGLGDAEGQITRHGVDRMSVRDGNSIKLTAEQLFPNVFRNPKFEGCQFVVGLASGEEVRNLIVDGVRCTIDYGLVEGSRGFDQRKSDVDRAIERYRNKWEQASPDGLMMGENAKCEPGDIVGWAEIEINYPMKNEDGTQRHEYVLAPIIPFPLHGVKRQPSSYSVENMGPVGNDNSLFNVDWENRTKLTEGFVKYFDSSGGANKGMISLSQALDESRTLLDGTEIDIYIAKASTDSRKVGTDRRIKTMISLMALARMHGYNFVLKPDGTINEAAFPNNPEIREALMHDRISIGNWSRYLKNDIVFTADKRLNAFLKFECKKILDNNGNPSDYLANVYIDENGEKHNTHVMWEFEAMFEQGLNYEDSLLRFLYFVNPIDPDGRVKQFCPNGIDDTTNEALFRLYQEGGQIAQGYDRGVLQMRVPHRLDDGRMAYAWDNVYIGLSFFGEEYSGFSRPNVDGASNFLDGMNTMSMYGKRLSGTEAKSRAEWATGDIGRDYPHSNGSIERVSEDDD